MKLFMSYVNLTSFHVRHLTKRSPKCVERDLQFLERNGYIASLPHPENAFKPRVCYPTQKGWDWGLAEKLFEKSVRANSAKGAHNLPHDLIITDLHIRLFDLYGEALYWTQLYQHCWRRFGNDPNDRISADAFITFPVGNEHAVFWLEVERSRDSVKNGSSARMDKFDAYEHYHARGAYEEEFGNGSDFRVLWTFGSEDKALYTAGKAVKERNATRRHWILDETLIPTLTKESTVFITPRDVVHVPERRTFNAQRRYSFAEA